MGTQAETKQEASLPDNFKLPGYIRLDAAAWQLLNVRGWRLPVQFDE